MDLCVASIHGPNIDDPLLLSLLDNSETANLDVFSSAVSQRKWQCADILKQYINDFGLCDAHQLRIRSCVHQYATFILTLLFYFLLSVVL